MNRNLRKIIALTLAINALGGILPSSNLNLIADKAYAADIKNLEIEDSNDDTMYIYDDADCTSNHRVDSDELKSGKTYYTRQTSADEIRISIDGVDSDCVRVFNRDSSDDDAQDIGDDIKLSSGTNTITVRVYDEDPGDVSYSNDSYTSEYKIRVKYSGSDDDDDEDSDNVYLRDITLEGGDIEFSKRTYTYDVNVPEDLSKITIRARPDCDNDEIDDYKVKINGIKVDRDDKFKDDVSLKKGKNVIDIKVEDDDDNEQVYTLNITRGIVDTNATENKSNNNSADNSENDSKVVKTNQWIEINGAWKYNDASGNPIKNAWIQNYYVKDDGSMATGWLSRDGNWYYLGGDGAKKTGWQLVSGKWYYLDSQGKMQIGWMKDINGKYYYLNSDGSMAYNTIIGGYKLDADGAWIGR